MSSIPSSGTITAPPPPANSASYRIMVVDDSLVVRGVTSRALESDPALKVVASVSDGQKAIDMLKREPVDLIILDIEMPVMDGLTALQHLKAVDPGVQIVMSSTLTQNNAEISLRALSLGAADYIPKPSTSQELYNADEFKRLLVEKAKALGPVARRSGVRLPRAIATAIETKLAAPKPPIALRKEAISKPSIIAIGSSTGGPQALFNVIKAIGRDLTQPVVITQHMPPAFTTILAEHITRQCGVTCAEGKDGDILKPGNYYVAPGDFHMLLVRKGSETAIKLAKDPPENFCRPAVDPMLRSVAEIYGRNSLVVMLTGMGQDGWKGSEAIVKAGGTIIAQDEATSVVWGMPAAVANAGLCSAVLPLNEIGPYVKRIATKTGP